MRGALTVRPRLQLLKRLDVEAQEVVHGGVEFGDGWMVESGVWSMPVVMVGAVRDIGNTFGSGHR
jgi:hypothetical protein